MRHDFKRAAIPSRVCGVVVLVAFASTAFARDDERGKWKPDDGGLAQRVAALEAALAATQAELAHLKKNSVLELNGKLKLTKTNGYSTALFTGVNVQVVNGLGRTGTLNGLGNLIVGYNEPRVASEFFFPPLLEVCSNGTYTVQADCEANGSIWSINHKSGSHNIVGGQQNAYSSFGGLVVGRLSAINHEGASVSAGLNHTATGPYSSVSGGSHNTASGYYSSVSGGTQIAASGDESTVSGGGRNTAAGSRSSVSGGFSNSAPNSNSSVSGGVYNTAFGFTSSVSGGANNAASGEFSSVSGGLGVTAKGEWTWAAGGLCEPGQGGSCQKAPVNAVKVPTLPKPQRVPSPSK